MQWEDEALEKGISFGRSKENLIIKRQRTTAIRNNGEKLELTLTQLVALQDKSMWPVSSKSCLFFVNYNYDDFDQPGVSKCVSAVYEDSAGEDEELSLSPELDLVWNGSSESIDSDDSNAMEFGGPNNFSVLVSIFKTYEDEQTVFHHMANSIFPNCICYGDDLISANPYLNFIIPLSMHSPILFKSIIAAGAKLYYFKTGERFYLNFANTYNKEVMRTIPKMIVTKHTTSDTNWDEILATVLMLCFTDISSTCGEQWLVHLNRGKSLLYHQQVLDCANSSFLKFFIRYITSHEIMWETVKAPWNSINDLLSNEGLYEDLKNDNDINVDLVLGCSPYLLTLISKISDLGDCYESLKEESEDNRLMLEQLIAVQSEHIENELAHLKQVIVIEECEDEANSVNGIEAISEIKRATARIYLFARIDLTAYALHSKLFPEIAKYRDKFTKMKKLAQETIESIAKLQTCTMSLLWPLFVIGLVTTDFEGRYFILKKFHEMENHRGLASVRLARTTVESSWKERDLNTSSKVFTWNDLVKSKATTLSLA